MNATRKVTILAAMFIVCLVVAATSILWHMKKHNSELKPEDFKVMFDKAIPVGTQKAKVLSFLEMKKIEYGIYDNKTLEAMIRNVSGGMVQRSIHIFFIFNEHDVLIRYDIKNVYTGF